MPLRAADASRQPDASFPTVPYTIRGRWAQTDIRCAVDGRSAEARRLVDAVTAAASEWSSAGPVTITLGEGPPDARFSFETGSHGPCTPFGSGAGIAHTGPVEPGTFVHFDAASDWSAPGSLELSALHEVGHLLGLGHTERPSSLMHPDPLPGARIDENDRAGLASLYGGELAPASSDLVVRTEQGEESVLLWRAAPASIDFAVFDTDGDGRDEVVVWRTDAAGQGLVASYAFDERMGLSHTVGPMLGAVLPGAPVRLGSTASGDRLLICARTGHPDVVRRFDERGRIAPMRTDSVRSDPMRTDQASEVELLAPAGAVGDLDGDGVLETVARRR